MASTLALLWGLGIVAIGAGQATPQPDAAYLLTASALEAPAVLGTYLIRAEQTHCDVAPPPAGGAPHPFALPATDLVVVWDDPDRPGRLCVTDELSAALNAAFAALPAGSYAWTVQARSAPASLVTPPVLTKPAPGACDAPPGRTLAIAVTVDSFTATVKAGARARAAFFVTSRWPVVAVALRLDGVEVASVQGPDVSAVTQLRYTAPVTPGPYGLTFTARDAAGCTYTSSLRRTVTVTK